MRSLLLLLSAFTALCSAVKEEGLLVKTTLGLVQGHLNEVGIREWRGIPYAQPPVGELRWAAPLPAKDYSGVYEATFNAPGCPQHCNLPPGNCPDWGTSEDCLYLTVFAPSAPSVDPAGYPVFFWIHGGAFEQGLGNCALYNGTSFAQKDVITVVLNYRLGALGFLASQSLEGNYGLLDQRLALQWTQDNIAAFGGDAARVTIGGQSAGAMSVGAHIVSVAPENTKSALTSQASASSSQGAQQAPRLFSAAIMESNPLGLPFHTRESATENAAAVFTYIGCAPEDVQCARSKSIEEILDAQDHAVKLDFDTLLLNFLPFAPMVEPGGLIPHQPLDALRDAQFSPLPVLQGSVYDEGQLFVYELFTKPLNKVAYEGIVSAVFGVKNAPLILKKYPFTLVEGTTDGRDVLNVLATDLLFYCPLRNITQGYQKTFSSKDVPTYTYRFKHVESFDCWGENYTFCVGTCCHGSELPFVFNVFTDGVSVSYEPTTDEKLLTGDLGNAWANFVHAGSPNAGLFSVPKQFPLYETATDLLLVLDEPGQTVQSHVRASYCDLWDRLGYFY